MPPPSTSQPPVLNRSSAGQPSSRLNLSPTGPARTQIGLMLRELERAFERSLEKESVEFGVTPSQVDILTVLSMNRWLGMTAIARELDIDRSTAAKAVRALVAKG
ncbi:MAG: MarR family transcriptional regulator, partial [Burkholderiaceae bacterium]